MTTAITSDAPLAELDEHGWLRAHAATLRSASAALAPAVATAATRSEAARQSVRRTRAQWDAWRAGLASLHGHPGGRLLVCAGCEAVCFAPGAHPDGRPDPDGTWLEPPEAIRDRLRDGWRGLPLVSARCGACRAASPSAFATDEAVGASLHRAGDVGSPGRLEAGALLGALAELDAAAARQRARAPWLTDDEAMARALDAAVSRLAGEIAAEDLGALVAHLRELARRIASGRPTGLARRPRGALDYRSGPHGR